METPVPQSGREQALVFDLLLPTLAAIVVMTAITVEVSRPFLDMQTMLHVGARDIRANILLYVPLGIALSRGHLLKALLVAALVSLAAEVVQWFYPNRYPSPVDIGANIVGAALGLALARIFRRVAHLDLDEIPGNKMIGMVALFACATFILVTSRTDKRTDFSNWDPSFQLAVGREPGGSRRWHGEIQGLAIFDSPLAINDIRSIGRAGPNPIDTSANDLLYQAPQAMDETAPGWGSPLLSPDANRALIETLIERGTFSILVWFRPYDVRATGPAPIVASSENALRRNFAIGQEGTRLKFLLRTPLTGRSGYYPHITTPSIVRPGQDIFVAATFDGRVTRIYRDGRLTARLNMAALGWRLPFLADAGLPATAALAGMLAGASVLCLGGVAALRRKWLLAATVGLVAGGGLVLVGASAALPSFTVWVPVFAIAGALAVAAAARLRPKHR